MNRRAKLVFGVMVAFMATVVLANMLLIVRATSDESFAVEENYYQRAVAWDDEQEARRKSDALGWRMIVTPSRNGVVVDLMDALGRPISDAHVSVEAFHSARAARRLHALLAHRGRGVYFTDRGFDRPGLWVYRFVAERGTDRFEERMEATIE